MKIKLTLSVLISLLFFSKIKLVAQNWASVGTTWSYVEYNETFTWPDSRRVIQLKAARDSLFNGKLTSVITIQPRAGCTANYGPEILTYEENGDILVKLNGAHAFDTLFRFNAVPETSWHFSFTNTDSCFTNTFLFEVIDTSSITINGEIRRAQSYTATMLDNQSCVELQHDTLEIIEGIGPTSSYLFPFFDYLCDGSYFAGLRCFEDALLGVYTPNPVVLDCERITEFNDSEWAPVGAQWYYTAIQAFIEPFTQRVSTITCIGDSLHQGIPTRVLQTDGPINCLDSLGGTVLTYSDNGIILVKLNARQPFDTLYNFNAEVGDTWRFDLISDCSSPRFVEFEVIGIATIQIDGAQRRLYDYWVRDSMVFCDGYVEYSFQVIEGIGASTYLFPFQNPACDGESITNFRCYEDPIIGLYKHDPSIPRCGVIVNVSETNPIPLVQVYPNPVSEQLAIKGAVSPYLTYQLLDAQGKIVCSGVLTEPTISMATFPSGIYFIRLKARDWTIVRQLVKL